MPRRKSSRIPGRAAVAALSALFAAVLLAVALSSCGYHVAGRGNSLPAAWRTIAVPALRNRTTSYRIEQRMTQAVVREMLARTHYRIVPEEKDADAVLRGEITSIETTALLFDTVTNRATAMLVTVRMQVQLVDRVSGKITYQNNDFLFREEYEISTDIPSFFEEQGPALGRLAQDFAATLVSALLENF